jgi:hypothetical protein
MKWTLGLGVIAVVQLAACSNTPIPPGMAAPGVMGAGSGTTPVGTAGASAVPAGSVVTPPTGAGGSTSVAVTSTAGVAATAAGTGTSTAGMGAAGSGAVASATAGSGAAGAGSAGSGTAGGNAAGAGGSAASGFKPKCLTKGAELALVGDSWINYTEQLAPKLASRAIMDKALPAGGSYNDQAIPGTSLAGFGLGLIPDQWPSVQAAAKAAGVTTKFVVMDGGGNDILLGQPACLTDGVGNEKNATCMQAVAAATMAGKMLQQKMIMDGVGQAVYFFYPHVYAGGWDVLDYSLPMAKATCESMNSPTYQCYFIDLREAFQGAGNNGVAMRDLIAADDIHPTAKGDNLLADIVWKTMKDHCMAQPASSGCCTP